MKAGTSPAPLLPIILAMALFGSVSASAHEPKPSTEAAKMSTHADASMQMHRIMMPMKMEMPMSGNVDKDFAMMMTMHHQQAIEMADVLIQSGHDPKLKEMARKMKVDQQEEIKQMAKYTK